MLCTLSSWLLERVDKKMQQGVTSLLSSFLHSRCKFHETYQESATKKYLICVEIWSLRNARIGNYFIIENWNFVICSKFQHCTNKSWISTAQIVSVSCSLNICCELSPSPSFGRVLVPKLNLYHIKHCHSINDLLDVEYCKMWLKTKFDECVPWILKSVLFTQSSSFCERWF